MNWENVKREREKRALLKNRHRASFERLSTLLFEHDPIGIADETNLDEYEAEAGTILPRLRSCRSPEDVLNVICQEFTRWFGEEYATPDAYRAVAAAIWNDPCLNAFISSTPDDDGK